MNQSDSRVQDLCARIAVEQDRERFMKLVQELNQLLSVKDRTLRNNEPSDQETV
jgi:hypothetical protein